MLKEIPAGLLFDAVCGNAKEKEEAIAWLKANTIYKPKDIDKV